MKPFFFNYMRKEQMIKKSSSIKKITPYQTRKPGQPKLLYKTCKPR